MVDFLENQNILICKQHGFRKGKSCLSQLLKQYDDILKNLMNHTETDVIYLDFAKAFDKVDHAILLQKLKNIGIGGELLSWISDFLTDRSQVVVVDGVFSYLAKVVSGVPQGTVLGPLLFLWPLVVAFAIHPTSVEAVHISYCASVGVVDLLLTTADCLT